MKSQKDFARGSIYGSQIQASPEIAHPRDALWQTTESGLNLAIFTSFLDEGVLRRVGPRRSDSFTGSVIERATFKSSNSP
jgi:hypothetical protein